MQRTETSRRAARGVLAVCGLTLGLAGLTAAPALAAPVAAGVALAATPEVEVGETVEVAIDLTGLVDVYAYELTISFDGALFDYVDDSAAGAPAGGFDAVESDEGTVTLVHTRLGSSPAFAGDLPITLELLSTDDGEGTVAVESVHLVDADSATADIEPLPTADVTVTAPPVDPGDGDGGGSGGDSDSGGDPTPTPAPEAGDDLASTGADALPYGLLALALLAAGGILTGAVVLRRRIGGVR